MKSKDQILLERAYVRIIEGTEPNVEFPGWLKRNS